MGVVGKAFSDGSDRILLSGRNYASHECVEVAHQKVDETKTLLDGSTFSFLGLGEEFYRPPPPHEGDEVVGGLLGCHSWKIGFQGLYLL